MPRIQTAVSTPPAPRRWQSGALTGLLLLLIAEAGVAAMAIPLILPAPPQQSLTDCGATETRIWKLGAYGRSLAHAGGVLDSDAAWRLELDIVHSGPPSGISVSVKGRKLLDLSRYDAFDRSGLPNRNLYAQIVCANGQLQTLCPREGPVAWCAKTLGSRRDTIDCEADPRIGTRGETIRSFLHDRGASDLTDSILWQRIGSAGNRWRGSVSLGLTAYEPDLEVQLETRCDSATQVLALNLVPDATRMRLGVVFGSADSLPSVETEAATAALDEVGTRLIRVAIGGYDTRAACPMDSETATPDPAGCLQREHMAKLITRLLQRDVSVHLRIRPSIEDFLPPDRALARPFRTMSRNEPNAANGDSRGMPSSVFEPDDPTTPYDESVIAERNRAIADARNLCPATRNFAFALSRIDSALFRQRMRRYLAFIAQTALRPLGDKGRIDTLALFNEINSICNNGDIFPVPQADSRGTFDQFAAAQPMGRQFLEAAFDRRQASVHKYAELLRILIEVMHEPGLSPFFGRTKVMAFSNSLTPEIVARYEAADSSQARIAVPLYIRPRAFFEAIAQETYGGHSLAEHVDAAGLNIYPRVNDDADQRRAARDIQRTINTTAGFLRRELTATALYKTRIWITELGFHQYRVPNDFGEHTLRTSQQRFDHYYRTLQLLMNRRDLGIDGAFVYGVAPVRNPLILRTSEPGATGLLARPAEALLPEAEILRYSW